MPLTFYHFLCAYVPLTLCPLLLCAFSLQSLVCSFYVFFNQKPETTNQRPLFAVQCSPYALTLSGLQPSVFGLFSRHSIFGFLKKRETHKSGRPAEPHNQQKSYNPSRLRGSNSDAVQIQKQDKNFRCVERPPVRPFHYLSTLPKNPET